MLRITTIALALLLATLAAGAQAQRIAPDIRMPAHQRILLLRGEEQAIARDIASDSSRRRIHEAIIIGAGEVRALPSIERIQDGRRLLDKSREALRRIFLLAYAARLTGDDAHFRRAERDGITRTPAPGVVFTRHVPFRREDT